MKSWLAGGFNTKVVNRIMDLVSSRQVNAKQLKIYITGTAQISSYSPRQLKDPHPCHDAVIGLCLLTTMFCCVFLNLLDLVEAHLAAK